MAPRDRATASSTRTVALPSRPMAPRHIPNVAIPFPARDPILYFKIVVLLRAYTAADSPAAHEHYRLNIRQVSPFRVKSFSSQERMRSVDSFSFTLRARGNVIMTRAP